MSIDIEENIDKNIIDSSTTEFDLPFWIHSLLQEEPFMAKVSRYLRKVPCYDIPTAGVRLNANTISYELAYNPKFFASLSREHKLGVLKHEFYHIVLGHVTERKPQGVNTQRANIAMDLAINSLPDMIGKLPDCALMPGKAPFENLAPTQAMEWYLSKLPKDVGETDSFDDHSKWDPNSSEQNKNAQNQGNNQDGDSQGEVGEAIKEIAAHKLREVIIKAVEETDKESMQGGQAWGNVSAETRKLIKAALIYKLDPKKVLAFFIKTSIRSNKKHRITKINKRWPYVHPGRAWDRRANIAISIDQSGSVGDDMLEKFFGWLCELAKFANFTVIPFDDQVFEQKIYVWKKGEKKARERVLCGGTNFDAPTDYVNKHDFDGHLILTDLCAPKPKNSTCQRMWITDARCASHPYFQTSERILVVD